MQQSSVIFANLLVAYLLFITMRGELPVYITLLRGGGQQAQGGASGTNTASGNSNSDTTAGAIINSANHWGPIPTLIQIPGGNSDGSNVDYLTQLTGG